MTDLFDSVTGEVVENSGQAVRDFYVVREPVYAPGFGPGDPDQVSMTRQEFAEESDINVLMAKYDKVGVWPLPPNNAVPQYLDVSDVPDLMGAYAAISAAEKAFMTLPASVRREFDNDPVRFVEYAQDPANLPQMREWKLAPPLPTSSAAASATPLSSLSEAGSGLHTSSS